MWGRLSKPADLVSSGSSRPEGRGAARNGWPHGFITMVKFSRRTFLASAAAAVARASEQSAERSPAFESADDLVRWRRV